jgi:iron only hydrogenase large subunit-like protein
MVEKSNPELIPYLSTCKSPQMMLGAVIKNYFAQETGLAAADITNVSVMPCVRKQGEADREWFNTSGGCSAVLKARGNVRLCSQWVLRWDLPACNLATQLGTRGAVGGG